MSKWEYKIQKFQIQNPGKAEEALQIWGDLGFQIVFATAKDANVVVILGREYDVPHTVTPASKRPVGRPRKSETDGPSTSAE